MNIFFDMEFTGLHQYTTPISIGLVNDYDETFYAEFADYDKSQVDKWIKEHVIANLYLKPGYANHNTDTNCIIICGTKEKIAMALKGWLLSIDAWIEVWSDCLAYDWVLFCQLWNHAFNIPKNVKHLPFDICTLFKMKMIDPDINREEFAGLKENTQKHNALWDAKVIKACYEKLIK